MDDLLGRPDPLAVDVMQAIVDACESANELVMVGAGPLEDLLSHNGFASRFVDDIEARTWRQPRFRQALCGAWLSGTVPADVRRRLAVLGAKDIG